MINKISFQSFIFPTEQEIKEDSFCLKYGAHNQKEIVNKKLSLRDEIQTQSLIYALASVTIGAGFCIDEYLSPILWQGYPEVWGILGWMSVAIPSSYMIFNKIADACTKLNGDIYHNAQILNTANNEE
ncbi:MAG: hypothetical protein ABIF40_01345 [archaeon]